MAPVERPARSAHRRILTAVVLLGVGWFSGAFDRQLAEVGLNRHTCVDPLIGGTLCGDDLVAFCRERYDPQINDEVCGPVRRDADEREVGLEMALANLELVRGPLGLDHSGEDEETLQLAGGRMLETGADRESGG
jgi:hypothetical protein